MVRKVQKTLKSSVFPLMKQMISMYGLTADIKVNNSDLIMRHLPTGNIMFFMGMDDKEKIKSITGENGPIRKVVMEEMSDFDREDFDQLNARLRGRSKIVMQIVGMFNPISEEHWLKAAFWDNHDYEDVYTHESSYKDNLFLDPVYKKQLESYKHSNPYFYDVYCRGAWGSIDDNDVIIAYHLAHAARYREEAEDKGALCVGIDVARYGDDETVIYIKRGLTVLRKQVLKKKESSEIAAMALKMITLERQGKNDIVRINIDATGLGSGLVDMVNLFTQYVPNVTVNEVHFGGKAEEENVYENAVTEMYFNLAKLMPEMNLLKWDAEVIPELTKRKYSVDWKTSRMKIEKKDDFKKRVNRSPDSADALALAFYTGKGHNKVDKIDYTFLRGIK